MLTTCSVIRTASKLGKAALECEGRAVTEVEFNHIDLLVDGRCNHLHSNACNVQRHLLAFYFSRHAAVSADLLALRQTLNDGDGTLIAAVNWPGRAVADAV